MLLLACTLIEVSVYAYVSVTFVDPALNHDSAHPLWGAPREFVSAGHRTAFAVLLHLVNIRSCCRLVGALEFQI